LERRATLVYCPYGKEKPFWADVGYIREGKKYIYFKRKDAWENEDFHQYKPEEVIVIDGWHEDIIEQVLAFREKEREYLEKRKQFQRQLECDLNHMLLQKLDEWDKQNPPPKFTLPKSPLSLM
jgi:hypothetical protein